jgi:hypothetical protein
VITHDQILRSHLITSHSASAKEKREILLSLGMDCAFLLSINVQRERSLARKPDLSNHLKALPGWNGSGGRKRAEYD